MNDALKKALGVVNRGTSKALSSKYLNSNHDNTRSTAKAPLEMRNISHQKPFNPYKYKYQRLCKRGFKYSVNPLAKYIYQNVDTSKESPNRKIKKFMMRKHNRLVLSLLSKDDKYDLPCVSYHRFRYYQVNALQYVYILARAHKNTAIGLRKAVAEIIRTVVSGGLTPKEVIYFALKHRGGSHD